MIKDSLGLLIGQVHKIMFKINQFQQYNMKMDHNLIYLSNLHSSHLLRICH